MKPGPYKSSTHGNITLSERGRTLLAAERDAVQGAIRVGDFSTDNQALSRTRGDIALYISHLERFPVGGTEFEKQMYLCECERERKKVAAEQDAKRQNEEFADERLARAHQAKHDATYYDIVEKAQSFWARYQFHTIGRHLAAYEPTKEKTMNDKTNGEAGPAAEKFRSQLIGEATHELVAAQRNLEQILAADTTIPKSIYLIDGGQMGSAIAPLVLEQWVALSKKAVARARARVAKAEKAVSTLLT